MMRWPTLLLFLTLLAINCLEDPLGSSEKQIWPLSPGNKWIGTLSDIDSTGAVLSTSTMSYIVRSDTVIGNRKWYVVDVVLGQDPYPQLLYTMLMTNRNDGLWADITFNPEENDASGINPIHWLKYPAKVGDAYSTGDVDSIEIISVEREIITDHAEYDCIEYFFVREPGLGDTRHYACPGVGLVKFEVLNPPSFGSNREWMLDKAIVK